MGDNQDELSEIERELKARFDPSNRARFQSTAPETTSDYVKALVLPPEARGRLPLTREDFVLEDNPAKVEWEREVRRFCKELSRERGHRITAPMIYEWATGISIKELVEAEGVDMANWHGGAYNGSANTHLRHINAILREYFGKPFKTTILGRPVGKAYTVQPGFRIERKKPACMTLWPDFDEGTLNP